MQIGSALHEQWRVVGLSRRHHAHLRTHPTNRNSKAKPGVHRADLKATHHTELESYVRAPTRVPDAPASSLPQPSK